MFSPGPPPGAGATEPGPTPDKGCVFPAGGPTDGHMATGPRGTGTACRPGRGLRIPGPGSLLILKFKHITPPGAEGRAVNAQEGAGPSSRGGSSCEGLRERGVPSGRSIKTEVKVKQRIRQTLRSSEPERRPPSRLSLCRSRTQSTEPLPAAPRPGTAWVCALGSELTGLETGSPWSPSWATRGPRSS